MKANRETLRQKMDVIDENMEYLEEVKDSFSAEDADFESLQAVKHSLLEVIEACVDIGSHIIASESLGKPSEYSEIFPELAENGIIDEKLGRKLSEMARFRNVLVHRYDEIDEKRVEEYLKNDLENVRKFTSRIYSYMDED